jgi:hypothetical protein
LKLQGIAGRNPQNVIFNPSGNTLYEFRKSIVPTNQEVKDEVTLNTKDPTLEIITFLKP